MMVKVLGEAFSIRDEGYNITPEDGPISQKYIRVP
jgi:hypothetical protein